MKHWIVVDSNSMALTEISKTKVFGGWQKFFSHDSKECKCKMKFGVYLPPQAESQKVPVLYFLAGLIANEENFVIKAGAQRLAAKHGVAVVTPDTSPRGCNIEGEEDSWEFGTSAGFYVDATEDKWKNNYRMYSYVTKELPALVNAEFPVLPDRQSITGHSMGGHGAMVCFLKNPGQYRSASAFAPIGLPIKSAWGIRCFSGYLGETNKEAWKEYDSGCLVKKYKGPLVPILVDQGTRDPWLPKDLIHPNELAAAFAEAKVPLNLRWHEDYDHSYFFLATFLEDHFDHHVKYLKE